MNMCSQNCSGAYNKAGSIRASIESGKIDILILTETHMKQQHLHKFNQDIGYNCSAGKEKIIHDVSSTGDYKGVTIIIKKSLPITIIDISKSEVGHHIVMKAKFRNKDIVIIAVYGESSGSDQLSLNVIRRACLVAQRKIDSSIDPIILCTGDFNFITINTDHSNANYNRKQNAEYHFNEFVRKNNLIDVHLDHSEGLPNHTFKRPNLDSWISSRLDRMYISEQHIVKPTFKTEKLLQSDHDSLHYNWNPEKFTKRMRFPDHMLTSEKLQSDLHDLVRETLILNTNDTFIQEAYHRTVPDDIFMQEHSEFIQKLDKEKKEKLAEERSITKFELNFQEKSTKYRRMKLKTFAERFDTQEQPQEIFYTLRQIGNAAAEMITDPENVINDILTRSVAEGMRFAKRSRKRSTKELEEIKEKIQKHENARIPYNDKLRQLHQRRKKLEEEREFGNKFMRIAKYNACTAKHTSYFLADSAFTSKANIDHIIDKNGTSYRDDDATKYAQTHFENFFKAAATSPQADGDTIPNFLRNIPPEKIRTIPREILDQYDNKITVEELDYVMNKNHNGSAPGLSGISYQLAKSIYIPLRPLLLKFVNETLDKDVLSPFLRNRKVIFIPKPNKPQTDIGSLRPICLLEIPYKIVSSVIAERIKDLSKYVLTYHQNAYTTNSNIANCSRTILDFRSLSCKTKSPLAIIGLDFSSAFDCISHSFCFETMRYMGFPEGLIKNIKTLINKPMISLSINGQISEPFQQADVGSGQGDPISAFLFTISITPLLLRLAYDPEIKRMEHTYRNVDGEEEKVIGEPVGFADDIHVFLDPTNPGNLHTLMNCLQEFSNISNLKLNNKKTEVLPINTPDETINAANELELKIVDSIKFVGAHTINNDDHKREIDLNFASANEKSENLMAKTEQRHVSSIGASIIYNTRVLSKYTHLLYNFHPSKEDCEYMNNRARNFVRSFDGGRFLVTKEILHPTSIWGAKPKTI